MSSSDELLKQVEAVLTKRAIAQSTPTDVDLFPVYNLLLPTDPTHTNHASSSSSSAVCPAHWYCHKSPTPIHREAASYLIILFAYRREGMPKTWLDALENVLKGCEECARAFGCARRHFAAV